MPSPRRNTSAQQAETTVVAAQESVAVAEAPASTETPEQAAERRARRPVQTYWWQWGAQRNENVGNVTFHPDNETEKAFADMLCHAKRKATIEAGEHLFETRINEAKAAAFAQIPKRVEGDIEVFTFNGNEIKVVWAEGRGTGKFATVNPEVIPTADPAAEVTVEAETAPEVTVTEGVEGDEIENPFAS